MVIFIKHLLGYFILLISYVFPRISTIWVFGGENNAKYLYYKLNEKAADINCIWISKSKKEVAQVRSLKCKAFYLWSLKGLLYSLIAGRYIYTFSVSDINPWTIGWAKRINLWHGVGIKNIEFKCKLGPLTKKYNPNSLKSRFLYPYLFFRPHLFLSTSPLMTKHFTERFRISEDRCVEAMYPRNEILLWAHDKIEEFLKRYNKKQELDVIEDCASYSYVYIYMPTWREDKRNILEIIDFDRLNQLCIKNNDLFLFRLHPNTEINLDMLVSYSNLRIIDSSCDIYPILPFTDVLITDYSSIYYDYMLIPNKQILLFPFDEEEYCTLNRDLAFDYKIYTPGIRVYSFEALLEIVESKKNLNIKEIKVIKELFWKGRNESIIDRIINL